MATALEVADEIVELGDELAARKGSLRDATIRKLERRVKQVTASVKEAKEEVHELLAEGDLEPSDAGLCLEILQRLIDCVSLCDTLRRALMTQPGDTPILSEALYSTLDDANDLMSQLPT